MIGSTDVLGDEFRAMFLHVGIDEQQENTCVQKLSVEDSICDGGKLLRDGVFTYPSDKEDNELFEYCVDGDNCD